MEKEIELILDSFISDFDQRKLELLDRILLSLLLKKEVLLWRGKNRIRTRKIEEILDRYHSYRDLLRRRLLKMGGVNKDFLEKKIYSAPTRLILLITHRCQLRCKDCRVGKFPAVMNEKILFRGIDLLFTSNRDDIQLQFFGGEPLLEFELIKKAVAYAERLNERLRKNLKFILTTNGILMTKERIDFLKKHNFFIECSVDGEIENQLKTRKAHNGKNYYTQVMRNFKYLFDSDIPHYSISVFMPDNVSSMYRNFKHLVNAGFKKLQMNYSLGIFWPKKSINTLFRQSQRIFEFVREKKGVEFINLTSLRREPVVLNAELTVDCDGGIYLESGICLEEDFFSMKKKFLVSCLSKAENIGFYTTTPFQNFYRLTKAYAEAYPDFRNIILNNIFLGRMYGEFLKRGCWGNVKIRGEYPW